MTRELTHRIAITIHLDRPARAETNHACFHPTSLLLYVIANYENLEIPLQQLRIGTRLAAADADAISERSKRVRELAT